MWGDAVGQQPVFAAYPFLPPASFLFHLAQLGPPRSIVKSDMLEHGLDFEILTRR